MEKVREKNKHKSKRYYGKPETEIPYFRDLGSKDDEGVRDIIVGRRCTETSACDRVEENIAPCGGKTDPSANVGAGKAPENTTESESAASATVAEAVNAEKSDGETAHAETDTAKSDGEMEKPECEDNGFAFNIMFRNHAEDADPYRDRRTIAVADGLGGSGSCFMPMDDASVNKIKRIIVAAVEGQSVEKRPCGTDCRTDCGADCFAKSWSEYVKYICDAKGEKEFRATHAAVSSRIVMAVFNGMVEMFRASDRRVLDEDFAERFRKAAVFALRETANQLGVSSLTDAMSHASVLPSTFVAASVEEVSRDFAMIRVFWAGDSRCYFMDENSLCVLSNDEEDASGGLINFMTGDKKTVALNYARFAYAQGKPFAVFVCSDGLFDMPGDDSVFGLAGKMRTAFAESGNMTEVGIRLRAQCEPRVGDDCSVALVSFGGFEAVRSAVMTLGDKFAGLKEEKDRLEYDIRYAEDPAAVENLCGTMQNRCRSNAVEIAERILAVSKQEFGSEMLEELIGGVDITHDLHKEAQAILTGKDIVFAVNDGLSKVATEQLKNLRRLIGGEDTAQRVGDGKHIGVEEAAFCIAVAVLRELNDKGVEYRVDVPMNDEDRIAALVSLMEKHPRRVVEIIAHHGKSVAVGFNGAYAALYENLLRAKDRAGDEMSARIGDLKACIAASTQRLPIERSVVFR